MQSVINVKYCQVFTTIYIAFCEILVCLNLSELQILLKAWS